MGAVDHLERILIEQVIQEPIHGMLDGRKSIMCSLNVVGVILLTVAICTVQAGNSTGNSTKTTTKPTTTIPTTKPGNSTGNSTKSTTKPTTIKPTTKPGNSTMYCCKYCSNSNSTMPTTNSTTITPTTKPGNNTGNSTTKSTTIKPTTKPGNSTGNSTKPTTKPTPIMPTTNSEFVHTEKGVTCSDQGFIDLSHQQECAAAVSHAKSFNSKAIFMAREDNLNRHKGCWIHDSGAVWFNAHVTGSRSSFVTSLCKKGCLNSDGLTGFYHTHAGYWTVGHTSKGIKTRMECANNCTQNCVAFNTHALNTSSKGECYHYSNRSGLITENERLSERSKAYIKCLVARYHKAARGKLCSKNGFS